MSRDTEVDRGVKTIFYGHVCIKQCSSNDSAVQMTLYRVPFYIGDIL